VTALSETLAARPHLFPRIDGAGEHTARGYAEGYAAGLRAAVPESTRRETERTAHAEARQAVDSAAIISALAALDHATSAWSARATQHRDEVWASLAATSIELAAVILGSAVLDVEAAARAAIERVLAHEEADTLTRVRVNPLDLATVTEHLSATQGEAVPLIGDARIARGDALGDFVDGELDARLTTALDRCRALLAEESGA